MLVPMFAPITIGMAVLTSKTSLETKATITVVHVEELCTRTVKSTPIINPTIGLVNVSPVNMELADFPVISRKASVRNVSEQMKKYSSKRRARNRAIPIAHPNIFSFLVAGVCPVHPITCLGSVVNILVCFASLQSRCTAP